MASLLGGLGGAAAGFATGSVPGAILGGLSGLFGGGSAPKLSPEQAALAKQQAEASRLLMQYGTNAPGSSPDEVQALAQDRGVLGQQQRNQQQALFANMGNPANAQPYINDFLKNISSQQTGQQMMLDEQHMMDALSRRREALLQAANVGKSAYEMAQPGAPASQLPQLLGQLSQALAYRRTLRNGQNSDSGNIQIPTTKGGGHPTGGWQGIPYATPQPAGQPADYTAADYNATYDPGPSPADPGAGVQALTEGLPQPLFMQQPAQQDTAGGGSSAGDDPVLAAVLHVLAKHGYKIQPDKGKGQTKKAKVGDDPQMMAMQAMMGQPPATGGMLGAPPMGQGAQAPGNEMYGANAAANQIRQAGGYGYRTMKAPGGLVFSY